MSNVVFTNLSMKNFMAFGNIPTAIVLDGGTTFGVIGENRDIGGEGSSRNGASKTSIMAGIIYGAFGKSIDKLKADEFINLTNGNKMVVELGFSKNGIDYTIARGRKPNYLTFQATTDGETTDLTRDSMANTDKDIEKTLGMTYDIFMSTVFLSPHREAFYEMGAPAQRNIIEQMLSLDVLTERAEAVKVIKSDLMVDIKVNSREMELYETTIAQWETRKTRLTQSVERWDEDKNSTLVTLKQEVDTQSAIPIDDIRVLLKEMDRSVSERDKTKIDIANGEADLKSKNQHNLHVDMLETDIDRLKHQKETETTKTEKELQSIEESLEAIGDVSDFNGYVSDYSEWKRLEMDMSVSKRDIKDADDTVSRGTIDIDRYMGEISAIVDGLCPTCGAHYEDEEKLRKTRKALEAVEMEIETATAKRTAASNVVHNIEVALEAIDEVVKTLTEVDITELKRAIEDVKTLTSRKTLIISQTKRDYDGEINILEARLAELGSPFTDDEIGEIEHLVNTLSGEYNRLTAEIETTRSELNKYGVITEVQLNDLMNKINGTKQRIGELEKQGNPHLPELTTHLTEEPLANAQLESNLVDLNEQVTHANYLIKLLTDSKSFIRRGILDRYIPFLNQKINGYLQEIGLAHVVEVSTDLNVDIIYMTKNVSYYNLSRGERLRLNIATTLAFRDLMKMIGKSNNLLLIDEVLDSGLDECGIISTATLLQKSADDVFLITHRSELMDTLDKKITVIKENGFAHIELS